MTNPKTVAIIQARMSSSRLPGKVLLDIAGEAMLGWVVERARRAGRLDEVVVATTTDPADQAVTDFCARHDYSCYRGSLHDVLDRFMQAARLHSAGVIVRITADCPMIDPGLIDAAVQAFLSPAPPALEEKLPRGVEPRPGGWDFVANRLPPPFKRTYPIGLDLEVTSMAALEHAWRAADQAYQREHVMPYLYEDSPVVDSLTGALSPAAAVSGREPHPFRVLLLNHAPDYGALRWTVDTPTDLELVRRIFARFGGRADFSWEEVLDLVNREPELSRLNAGVHHKTYKDADERANA